MGTIRIEYVPIQRYGLGFFGLNHLHVVYQDETDLIDSQDYWYVIEGVQEGSLFEGTLGALGENGRTSLAVANGASRDALVALIGTPDDRGSRIIARGPNVITQWDQMADYAGEIESQALPYIAVSLPFSAKPTINSTSLVASILWSIGIDINTVKPYGVGLTPGSATLIGTSGADTMRTTESFNQLVAGAGDDNLHGGQNDFFFEKLYGGAGKDTIHWSSGQNIHHGGQPGLDYADDGLDVVDYSNAGTVYISASLNPVEHKVSDYIAEFAGGTDYLFSIEGVLWDAASDNVIAGEGVEIVESPLLLDMKSESSGTGDVLSMSQSSVALIINAADKYTSVQTVENQGQDAGYWAESVEWLAGSSADDLIYTSSTVRGAEGGEGDDLIDARLATPFSAQSPNGYDIEINGGEGADTIVSGAGRTSATGGAGGDRFVLSTMTTEDNAVEFVIEDADEGDSLYVPYSFFTINRGAFDGSTLFQLTGAPFKITETNPVSRFEWTSDPLNRVTGNIEFAGSIEYAMDGADLIIAISQGHPEEFTVDNGPGEPPGPTIILNAIEADTTAYIRVRNWQEGDLGLTFPITYDSATADEAGDYYDYPGLRDVMQAQTGANLFAAPLDIRPEGHVPQELASNAGAALRAAGESGRVTIDGTDGADQIATPETGYYRVSGAGGNDTLTGGIGGDILDGGSGDDEMRGGRGNDVYHVDSAADVVIELTNEGFDRVVSAVDYALGANVEHLNLTGSAISATGNALRNTLVGTDGNNVLSGNGGDDVLAGNLGDDILLGGDGSDRYVYELGDGRDVIAETAGLAGDTDALVLIGGLSPADIQFFRDPEAMSDLILRFEDGGRITLDDYFAGIGGIESIDFASGVVWDGAALAAAATNAVVATNFAPVARDDAFALTIGTTATLPGAAFLDNDSDEDGDALAIAEIRNASGANVALDGSGNVVVTRLAGDAEAATFDYVVSDGQGGTAMAHVVLGLNAPATNEPPVIVSATIAPVIEDQPASGAILATDSDGDALTFAVKSGAEPTKGTIALADDGSFVYTPNPDANGDDSFTLTVSDGRSDPVEQIFAFTIQPANESPTAADDGGYQVRSGQSLRLAAVALLDNDRDVDGGTLRITGVSNAIGGTVQSNAAGDVIFTAASDFAGTGSFTYTVDDGQGGSDVASVSIRIGATVAPNRLTGTIFRDVLTGTAQQDILTGRFASDTFVFKPDGGHDVVTDFSPGWWDWINRDVLDLKAFGFANFDAVMDHAYQDGTDTLIMLDSNSSVRLTGIAVAQLEADNFRLA